MEEVTMERLLSDFNVVIDQINTIVRNNDIESARRVLSQIETLVAEANGVELDNRPDPEMDHVLHDLLSNIRGVIQVTRTTDGKPGREGLTDEEREELERLLKEREELDKLIDEFEPKKIETEIIYRDVIRERIAYYEQLEGGTSDIDAQIAALRMEKAAIQRKYADGFEIDENLEGEQENDDGKRIREIDELIEKLTAEQEKSGSGNSQKAQDVLPVLKQLLELEKVPRFDAIYTKDLDELLAKYKEELANLDGSKSRGDIEARIQALKDKIKANTDKIVDNNEHQAKEGMHESYIEENRELDAENAQMRAEISDLEKQLLEIQNAPKSREDIEAKIQELKDKIKANTDKIVDNNEHQTKEGMHESYIEENLALDAENAELRAQIAELEELLSKGSVDNSREKERLTNIISELEGIRERSIKKTITNPEYSKLKNRRATIQRRINVLLKKEKEKEDPEPGTEITETLDLEKEAVERIGANIFRTAEVRRVLRKRNVSREEFLAFYEAGREQAVQNLQKINDEIEALQTKVRNMYVDSDSDKSLDVQIDEARRNGDNDKVIELAEKLRQRFIANEPDRMSGAGFDDPITTIEDAERFSTFSDEYLRGVDVELIGLREAYQNENENLEIINNEINTINQELETIRAGAAGIDGIIADAEEEKALRRAQLEMSMFGASDEQRQEWDRTFERFYEHRVEQSHTYIDRDGNEKRITMETIEDYPEQLADARYLDLKDYKKYLEYISLYENSGQDPYAIGFGEKFDEMERNNPGSGKRMVEEAIAEMKDYVASFNGRTNEMAIIYANHKTTGSTLKSMKPVRGELPATQMANALENTGRFLGIRIPRFTRKDENNNEVRDVRGGLMTIATDALVIGGVSALVASGPAGWAALGAGYAARGIVTVGNVVASRLDYRRNKYAIDHNIPTPYAVTAAAREQARKHYYRSEEGMGMFTSWLKAKTDRFPFRARGRETEERIIDQKMAVISEQIDARTSQAVEVLEENMRQAERNQEIRQSNYEKVAGDKNTYNDVYRDPIAVADFDKTAQRIAVNAAIESRGKEGKDINPDGKGPRESRYIKDPEELEQTQGMRDASGSADSRVDAAVAVTREEHYSGGQNRQDFRNRVWTMILTPVIKGGIDEIMKWNLEKQVTPGGTHKEPIYEQQEQFRDEPIYGEETVSTLDTSRRIGDLDMDGVGLNDTYGGPGSGLAGRTGDVDSMVLRYTDAAGKEKEVSVGEMGGFAQAGKHIHQQISTAKDFGDMTPLEALEAMANGDPASYQEYLAATGMQGKTPTEIITHAIKNGHFYTQDGAKGWQQILPSNVVDETKQIITGYEKVSDGFKDVLVGYKDVQDPDVVTWVRTGASVGKSLAEGAVAGAGFAAVDALHEASHKTDKIDPGTIEQHNDDFREASAVSRMIAKGQEEMNRRREEADRSEGTGDREDEEER